MNTVTTSNKEQHTAFHEMDDMLNITIYHLHEWLFDREDKKICL